MKSLVIFGCLLAVAAVVRADDASNELPEEMKEMMHKCMEEENVTEDEVEKFHKDGKDEADAETEHKMHCLTRCLLRVVGILKDGELQLEAAYDLANKLEPENEENRNKLKEVAERCVEDAKSETEECSLAGKYSGCFLSELDKIKKERQ